MTLDPSQFLSQSWLLDFLRADAQEREPPHARRPPDAPAPGLMAMAEAVGDVWRDDDGRRYLIRDHGPVLAAVDYGDLVVGYLTIPPDPAPVTASVEDMIAWTLGADDDERLWQRVRARFLVVVEPRIIVPEPRVTADVARVPDLVPVVTTPIYPHPVPGHGFDLDLGALYSQCMSMGAWVTDA